MAVKTITIDLEAYEILARHKKPGQSFSEVIKERLGPLKTAGEFRRMLREVKLSESTLDAIEAQVKARSRSIAKPAKV